MFDLLFISSAHCSQELLAKEIELAANRIKSKMDAIKNIDNHPEYPSYNGIIFDVEWSDDKGIDVNIVNDNTLTFQIDNRYLDMKGNITFVPYNTAGYYSSWQSYLSADAPAGVDAKGNPTTFLRYPQGCFIQVDPLPIDINKTILSVAGAPNNAAVFIPEDCD